jgi:hypothetical protein
MKQFFTILFATLCAIIIFSFLIFFSFAGVVIGSSSSEKTEIKSKSVLMLDLSDPILEQGQENQLGMLSGEPTSIAGLNNILNSIKAAQKDENIKGSIELFLIQLFNRKGKKTKSDIEIFTDLYKLLERSLKIEPNNFTY